MVITFSSDILPRVVFHVFVWGWGLIEQGAFVSKHISVRINMLLFSLWRMRPSYDQNFDHMMRTLRSTHILVNVRTYQWHRVTAKWAWENLKVSGFFFLKFWILPYKESLRSPNPFCSAARRSELQYFLARFLKTLPGQGSIPSRFGSPVVIWFGARNRAQKTAGNRACACPRGPRKDCVTNPELPCARTSMIILIAVFSWVHGKSELQISEKHAERFDQPEQASTWLQMCRSINGKFLTEVG